VGVEYRIGNRRVSRREWEKHLFEEAPRQAAEDEIKRKLGPIRCPVHGRAPTVNRGRTTRGGFDLEIEGCCEALVERATAALG
jgi:hypothetical protein